jgi:hypothetical protein
MTVERDFDYRWEQNIFFSPWRPGGLWGSSNYLSDRYRQLFSRDKAARCMPTHVSFSDEVNTAWAKPSHPPYVFMAWLLINQSLNLVYADYFITPRDTVIVSVTFVYFISCTYNLKSNFFHMLQSIFFFLEGIMFLFSDDGYSARKASCLLVLAE